MNKYNVAVIGATGNVGYNVLSILAERHFPINNVFAIASKKSVPQQVSFGDHVLDIQTVENTDFSSIDICFMCTASEISKRYADNITDKGCTIVDKTAYFRLYPDVPLIIPEVNGDLLRQGAKRGIIATPNCIVVPLAMTLAPIHKIFPIKRVVVSTYQSVSGAGKRAINELDLQTKATYSNSSANSYVFKKMIAFNVIPEIGDRLKSGETDEENKIKTEIFKIFNGDIRTAVTSVRVPVFIGHGMSVACEFHDKVDEHDVLAALNDLDGIRLIDRDDVIVTPLDVQHEDEVFVSRIRRDDSVENGLLMWIAADNMRKGAALNGIQIAEKMLEIDPSLAIFKK